MLHIPRFVIISLAVSLLAGCAAHPKTKNDMSAAGGFQEVKDGDEQVDNALFKLRSTKPTANQAAEITHAEEGSAKIKHGSGIASSAYEASAKLNEPTAQKQADRLNIATIIGAIAFAVGLGLVFGGGTAALKGLGIILAIAGGAFTGFLMLMQVLTRSLEIIGVGIAVVTVAAFAWFVFEKMRDRKKLAKEQVATREIAEALPVGQVNAIASQVSADTRSLLTKAKATNLRESQAETATNLRQSQAETATALDDATVT